MIIFCSINMNFRKVKMGKVGVRRSTPGGVGTGGRGAGGGSKLTEAIKDRIAYMCMDGSCKP